MSRRTLVVVSLAVLVLVAGCGGSGGAAVSSGGAGGDGAQGLDAAQEAGGDAGQATGDDAVVQAGRIVIRTGTVRLEVDSYGAARRNLTAAVEARGGYVSDASQQVHRNGEATWTSGRVTIRVPRENFSAMMTTVQAEGRVLESQTNTQDVTDRVVDLRARLDNLRAERDRLRTLYQQANDTEDVLAVAERLSDVQGEIERTEAKLRTLEQRVAYSTITVELQEPRPDRPAPEQWYDTPVLGAFLDSVHGVTVVLRALVVGTAYAAPYVLAFGGPLLAALLLFRRRRG
ncbi:DUF4349 domain-containing protein [Salinirarus marinus]|uniref:DUF4349 domain-containing protein n=1 Tax=Salinirarus marinus TaxID=3068310 RepID=UPI003C6BF2C3